MPHCLLLYRVLQLESSKAPPEVGNDTAAELYCKWLVQTNKQTNKQQKCVQHSLIPRPFPQSSFHTGSGQ